MESDCAYQGKGSGKTREDFKFTPQADPRHRDNLQPPPPQKAKPGFQSYHIISFTCPVFSKHSQTFKELGQHGLFKEKNKSTETVPKKDLMDFGGQQTVHPYIQSASPPTPINQEFFIWQKLSFKSEGEIKVFPNKQKLSEFMLKGVLPCE